MPVNEEEKVDLYDPDIDVELLTLHQRLVVLQGRVKGLEELMEQGTIILTQHAQAINMISQIIGRFLPKGDEKKNGKKIIS